MEKGCTYPRNRCGIERPCILWKGEWVESAHLTHAGRRDRARKRFASSNGFLFEHVYALSTISGRLCHVSKSISIKQRKDTAQSTVNPLKSASIRLFESGVQVRSFARIDTIYTGLKHRQLLDRPRHSSTWDMMEDCVNAESAGAYSQTVAIMLMFLYLRSQPKISDLTCWNKARGTIMHAPRLHATAPEREACLIYSTSSALASALLSGQNLG